MVKNLKPVEIKMLMKASYENNKSNIGDFIIDNDLSDSRVYVYTRRGTNDVIVVHRGSHGYKDWMGNFSYAANFDLKNDETYKKHKKKHMRAVEKYGAENIISLGHSRGSLYADEMHKQGLDAENINLNKPYNLVDLVKSTKKDKEDTQVNISTLLDPISVLGKLVQKDNDIIIPSTTINPFTEHKPDVLDRMEQDKLIGKGQNDSIDKLLSKHINFKKIRVAELREIIKTNKSKFNRKIKITGLTKPELIKLVDEIL